MKLARLVAKLLDWDVRRILAGACTAAAAAAAAAETPLFVRAMPAEPFMDPRAELGILPHTH